MKNHELITLLQQRHPDAQVEVYMHPSFTPHKRVDVGEYVLLELVGVGDWGTSSWSLGVGDWGNPGGADDLVTINAGMVTGG